MQALNIYLNINVISCFISLLQFFGFFLVSPVNDDDNDIDMDVLEISSDEDDNSMFFVNIIPSLLTVDSLAF